MWYNALMESNATKTSLAALFAAFFRVGLFTFGGGYAMLPMLTRECVEKYAWATRDELLNYFALSQCTPGVIAVNTATFVGGKQRGTGGAAAATLGVITPSIIIILIIAALLNSFAHLPAVQHAFAGIRVAVAALMLNAVIKLIRSSVKDGLSWGLFAMGLLAVAAFSLSPVIVVAAAAITGIAAGKAGAK